jgi:hypothetical protein
LRLKFDRRGAPPQLTPLGIEKMPIKRQSHIDA